MNPSNSKRRSGDLLKVISTTNVAPMWHQRWCFGYCEGRAHKTLEPSTWIYGDILSVFAYVWRVQNK